MGFRSLTESIDTKSSGGKFIFHVFGSLAEFERAIIKERTQAGLEAARARGKFPGRPRSLKKGDLDVALTLLKDPKISVSEIAKRIQVSEATFYWYFPGGSTESLGE